MPEALHFTSDPAACELLATDPFALLVGFAIDQQVPVPKAFAGPYVLKQRLGTLEPRALAGRDLREVFAEKPAIHRFPGSMAERVRELAAVVAEEYGGDASRIWTEATDSADLRKRIAALPGFGEMKIKSLAAVLAKQFGVEAAAGARPRPSHARRRLLGRGSRALPGVEARLQEGRQGCLRARRPSGSAPTTHSGCLRSRSGRPGRSPASSRLRELLPPVAAEEPRHGAGGVECHRCARGGDDALWANDHWLVTTLPWPTGLPLVCFLETRRHVDFPELDDELAAELGPMLLKVQRAVVSVGEIGNVHVCRWGDGSEHFHVWFMARPARVPQLLGSFAAIWDDVLPPLPERLWRQNLDQLRAALSAGA